MTQEVRKKVLQQLLQIKGLVEIGDYEAAHGSEQKLLEIVLKAIAANPTSTGNVWLAKQALLVMNQKWPRW